MAVGGELEQAREAVPSELGSLPGPDQGARKEGDPVEALGDGFVQEQDLLTLALGQQRPGELVAGSVGPEVGLEESPTYP